MSLQDRGCKHSSPIHYHPRSQQGTAAGMLHLQHRNTQQDTGSCLQSLDTHNLQCTAAVRLTHYHRKLQLWCRSSEHWLQSHRKIRLGKVTAETWPSKQNRRIRLCMATAPSVLDRNSPRHRGPPRPIRQRKTIRWHKHLQQSAPKLGKLTRQDTAFWSECQRKNIHLGMAAPRMIQQGRSFQSHSPTR